MIDQVQSQGQVQVRNQTRLFVFFVFTTGTCQNVSIFRAFRFIGIFFSFFRNQEKKVSSVEKPPANVQKESQASECTQRVLQPGICRIEPERGDFGPEEQLYGETCGGWQCKSEGSKFEWRIFSSIRNVVVDKISEGSCTVKKKSKRVEQDRETGRK